MPPQRITRPPSSNVKLLDYEDLRAYFEYRHSFKDDTKFWEYLTSLSNDRYIVISVTDIFLKCSDDVAMFAGMMQKDYKDNLYVVDTLKRKQLLDKKKA